MGQKTSQLQLAREMISTLPAWGRWAASMRDVETPHGKVGIRQAGILWQLRYETIPPEDRSTTGIAALLGVQNSVITRAAERLEHLGLIVRIVHEDDRRRSTIQITEAGMEVSVYIENLFTHAIVDAMGNLPQQDIDDLQKSIATLANIMDKLLHAPPGS